MIKNVHQRHRSTDYRLVTVNYVKQYGLQPADRIVGPIFLTGLTKHHAIYLGRDHHGTEWVAENDKFEGVRLIKAASFFAKEKVQRIERFHGNSFQQKAAVER